MKRVISILIVLIFIINTTLAYTVKVTVKGVGINTTGGVGNTIRIEPKVSEIKGWEVKSGNTTINNNEFTMPEGDVEIEGIVEEKYLLSVEFPTFIKQEQKVAGTSVTIEGIPAEGYSFKNWIATGITLTEEQKVSETITFIMPGNNVTLIANYEEINIPATYTISYNANGGTGAPGNQTKTHGTALTISSTTPTREGYTFKGWATSSTSTTATYQVGGSFTIDANTTLYAVWEVDKTTIKVGAYIAYTPSNTSYTVTTDDSGYTSNQTYNPSSITSWKVFKNNSGQLDIISSESVGSLFLNGKKGYQKAVYTLNKMSEAYINPTYADSGRSLGYVEGSSVGVIDTNEYPLNYGVSGGPYKDTYYIADQTIINTEVNGEYPLRHSGAVWLASRFSLKYETKSVWSFGIRTIEERYEWVSNNKAFNYFYYVNEDNSYGGSAGFYSGVRPIISLKSNIKIIGGTGTEIEPYILLID